METNPADLLTDDAARRHYESLTQWAAFGPVAAHCWTAIARPHLCALLPFKSMVGIFGRQWLGHIEITGLVSIDHPPEHLASLPRTFKREDRPIFARWLETQAPMLVDVPRSGAASCTELQEARRFGLDRLAIHGQVDLLGRSGTYFSFAGIPRPLAAARAEALLALLVPHLHIALCRMAKLGPQQAVALTANEGVLLRWLAVGRRSAEIAVISGCSEKTVRNRLTALYRKLGVASRAEAVREFMLRGS